MIISYLRYNAGRARELLCEKLFRQISRYRYWKRKITISPGARLNGARGIELGEGTIIYPNAVLCAGYLLHYESDLSEPVGSIVMGKNCTVMHGAILATYGGKIEIGSDVSINPNAIIYGNGNVRIGDKTLIATQVVIVSQNHIFSDTSRPIKEQGLSARGIVIGRDVWIGAGAKILDGIAVGDGAVIGAGAVVTANVAPYTVVAGVPAREISRRKISVN